MGWRDRAVQVPESVPVATEDSPVPSWRSRAQAVPATPAPEHEGPSAGASALAGAKQGLTFGFADELGGAEQAGLALLAKHAPGLADMLGIDTRHVDELDAADVYHHGRDENRAEDKAARDAHGGAYLLGNLAGGALAPVPGAGAAKGASLGARALAGVRQGALGGALGALGNSDADLTKGEVGKALLDTAIGGAGGALVGGGAPLVGRALSPVLKPVGAAIAKPLDAIGAKLEDMGIAQGKRVLTGGANPMTVRKPVSDGAVMEALESGAILPFGTTKGAHARLDELADAAGGQYGEIVDALRAKGVTGPRAQEVAQSLMRQAKQIEASTLNSRVPGRLRAIAKDLLTKETDQAGNLDLSLAEDLKRGLQADAKNEYNKLTQQITPMGQAKKDAASTLRRSVEDAIDQQSSLAPDEAAAFVPVKQRVGRLIEARDVAEKGAVQAGRRNAFSPRDVAAGAAMLAHGNPAGAPAAMGASHFMRTRGTSAAAWTAYHGGDIAQRLADVLTDSPEVLGKYAGILAQAASRGPQALELAHALLLKNDPGYRAQLGAD